jgi:hypothetical protein
MPGGDQPQGNQGRVDAQGIRSQGKRLLGELKQRIEKLIEANPALKQFKNQLLLDITSEGLRIQIVDEQNRPMFDSSSAEVKPYTKRDPARDRQGAEQCRQQDYRLRAHRCSTLRRRRERVLELGAFRQPCQFLAA